MVARDYDGLKDCIDHLGAAPVIIIRRTQGFSAQDLREIWRYRELVYFLTWRLVNVRYKQTVVGVAWAILQPLALMLAFTAFFKTFAQLPSEGVPYPLFAYAGLLPWQLFARTITESSGSLIANQRLITKVYFPRIIVPLSTTLAALVDFGISSVLLVVLMAVYGVGPTPRLLSLLGFIVLMIVVSLGIGLWLSALNAMYRDVTHIVPFLAQFWLFITPVVYPSSIVPPKWGLLYAVNPMVGVVESFRWALLGVGHGPPAQLVISVPIALVIFVTGLIWFRHCERTFIDVIGTGG